MPMKNAKPEGFSMHAARCEAAARDRKRKYEERKEQEKVQRENEVAWIVEHLFTGTCLHMSTDNCADPGYMSRLLYDLFNQFKKDEDYLLLTKWVDTEVEGKRTLVGLKVFHRESRNALFHPEQQAA